MHYKSVVRYLFFVLVMLHSTFLYAATKAPIDGSFYAVDKNLTKYRPIELVLDFSVLMNFDTVGVDLSLPKEVSLLKGELTQKLTNIEVGSSKRVRYVVEFNSDKELMILVTVKVLNLSDAVFSKDFIIMINSDEGANRPVFLKKKN
jgi:type II secretory pathway component PulC